MQHAMYALESEICSIRELTGDFRKRGKKQAYTKTYTFIPPKKRLKSERLLA